MAIRVISGGLLTTVQDLGRWGFQASGVPPAGPMDRVSHRWANRLVGNPDGAATLEITLEGPELFFDTPAIVAVSGAEFALTFDDHEVPMGTRIDMPRGGRLRFGARTAGARAYLAVAGGILIQEVLGSRATHLVSRLGGVAGRALIAGDVLPTVANPAAGSTLRPGPAPLSIPTGGATLRVMAGCHGERFEPAAQATLTGGRYTVSLQSNRMAYRLEGPRLEHRMANELISDAAPMGALQVPGSGLPMLLMADRATTGGYPVIAVVIAADLALGGQLAPGDWVEFALCSHVEAMRALIAQERVMLRS